MNIITLWKSCVVFDVSRTNYSYRGLSVLDLKEKNILVVDDMTSIRVIVSKLLVSFGAEEGLIDQAVNGVEALGKINEKQYDLIISDWNMPEMTGYDLLKIVKDDEKLREIPFVLLTSETDKTQVVAALKAKVNDFMAKPINKEVLYTKLSNIFK